MGQRPTYVGRFAPTPSGPLHLGSLLAATASWLDARSHGGRWLLRIDDLDAPRLDPRAEVAILSTLEAHGLAWDGPVARQSDHVDRYQAALAALADDSFGCACTRRQLRGVARYPGMCRDLGLPLAGNAVRLRVEEGVEAAFADRVQGQRRERLAETAGDIAIRRRDGLPAYPLAVVVDDAAMGVTSVVRGADLLANTPRQIHIAQRLGLAVPAYAHVPVVVDAAGLKLSKHTAATAIDDGHARQNLATVLALLGFDAPPAMDVAELLAWAQRRWCAEALPRSEALPGFVALS